ncbi:DUF1735 domain-containing protein [Pedobacter punctiformis]|uniref:DUF1735 domain-containing protein n=1 Tax=Pedobacter punctiformis TaxID=3004097 RepID=A0ABT4L5S7_9SPHI|nr:DUF1735 domain-containing protein [Pedobacter sp. HCMS5-2]MCZ4243276.1 DUF1735 domain-containing protein [Pedobacter sp. HCMS5-2]
MKKIINLLVALIFISGLSSCLKDDTIIGPDSPGAIKNIVEFKNVGAIASSTTAPFAVYIPFTLKPTATSAEFEGIINYAGADTAPSDIVVNIAADPSVIATYNAKVSGAAYAALPASSYSFPATVTIPAGQREAKFKITVKPNTFDATKENALALRITSASTGVISGNFGAVIFSMPLESVWQGTYDVHINNNYGTIDGNIGNFSDTGIKLATVGPNRLRTLSVADTYSGSTTFQFNGDNTSITGVVVISGTTTFATSIQGIDLIDPVNGKFTIRYTWGGRGMTETWTRTGP